MASHPDPLGAPTERLSIDASGQLSVQALAAPRPRQGVRALPRKSRWPARLDILQSASGLFLGLFLLAHMGFVSSILISHEVFYRVARFFEGAWLLGKPYPILVSGVVGLVTSVFVLHAWLALRKFPANFRQYLAFARHRNSFRHADTNMWWFQVWTGFALFFLATIHLYQMLTQPSLIGPFESADRVWTGGMWPLYLILLFAAELHGGIGLYRLAIKWGWFHARTAGQSRRRLRLGKSLLSTFFIVLGLVTLAAYVDLGRAHADKAGERYTPPAAVSSAKH
ncbi:fumarate reductase cytochrome b subunit [Azonexus sp. IMCC34839]|uniref:fumarate reductase cytochrome b subunit n=1 Tax=Azonexus sp. IMCC34839 TaxID=3133695 RepID=UPI00399B4001